jgi:hypothetical protein
VPTWVGEERAEDLMIKRPGYLSVVTERAGALDETTGELIARWAAGEDAAKAVEPTKRAPAPNAYAQIKRDLLAATASEDLDKPGRAIRDARGPITAAQRAELLPILDERTAVLLPRADQGGPNPDQDGR